MDVIIPTNLVCVLFDPFIPTSSFNFIVFYTCYNVIIALSLNDVILCLYISIVVCQHYEGYGFCHDVDGYSHGDWTVYVDRSRSEWESLGLDSVDLYLKNLLAQLTADIGDDVWTPGCDHEVRQLLCHATLPFCKKQGEQEKGGQ